MKKLSMILITVIIMIACNKEEPCVTPGYEFNLIGEHNTKWLDWSATTGSLIEVFEDGSIDTTFRLGEWVSCTNVTIYDSLYWNPQRVKLILNEDETFTLEFWHILICQSYYEHVELEIDSIKSGTWQQYAIDHYLLSFKQNLIQEGELELITIKAHPSTYDEDRYYLQIVMEKGYVANGINYLEVTTIPFLKDKEGPQWIYDPCLGSVGIGATGF